MIGAMYDNLIDKNPRSCKIIGVDELGKEGPESNFTDGWSGGVGLLQKHAADFIFTEATHWMIKDFLVVS